MIEMYAIIEVSNFGKYPGIIQSFGTARKSNDGIYCVVSFFKIPKGLNCYTAEEMREILSEDKRFITNDLE